MERKLWVEKEFTVFDDQDFSIARTCGNLKHDFIPYIRMYKDLTPHELQSLIRDARKYRWQALDLSDCGLTKLPDELWTLTDLRLLYLGISFYHPTGKKQNDFSHLPRAIENLKDLRVLSLYGLNVSVEGEGPLRLPRLVHLELFDCPYTAFRRPF